MDMPMSKQDLLIQLTAQGAPPEEIQAQVAKAVTWEDVIKLLRNDAKRSFRIDIETDSTIQADTQRFQRNIAEFAGAIGPMASGLVQMSEAGMLPPEMGITFMQALARGFKLPRQAMDALEEAGSAPKPQNDGAAQAEQMKMQAEQQRTQADLQKTQLDGQIAQMKAQTEQQRLQMDAQFMAEEHAFKMEELRFKHQATMTELQAKANQPKKEPAA
jgi:hypothetical protein